MATSSADICNQALRAIGSQATIRDLTQDSLEAQACNSIYSFVTDWCHTLTNWNFARKTATLTKTKTSTGSGAWSVGSPAPAWKYEYSLPSDFIRFLYVTNSENDGSKFLGNVQRAVVTNDTAPVVLTDTDGAILVYTARIGEQYWPPHFIRLAVSAVAWNIAGTVTGQKDLVQYFDSITTRMFMVAEQINRDEGLSIIDSTPEWIQAIGINYPYRRLDGKNDSIKR